MKTVALLPMKGNSERVQGKNFKVLGTKPLFAWVLDSLLELEEIDLVVINTDAASTLERFGVTRDEKVLVRERKKEICGDLVSMNKIIKDDLDAVVADRYVMTHTTNPFLSSQTIRAALSSLADNQSKYDSLFSVNKIQTRFYRADGTAVNHDPDNLIRTQDLEPWYEENSCLYVFSNESFAGTHARIGSRPMLFETPQLESVDIDEPVDWEIANSLATTIFGSSA